MPECVWKALELIVMGIYSILSVTLRWKRAQDREVALVWNRTYLFLQSKLTIPFYLHDFLPPPFLSFTLSPCLLFIYTSPFLSAVAQGAVTEVSVVIIGLIQ